MIGGLLKGRQHTTALIRGNSRGKKENPMMKTNGIPICIILALLVLMSGCGKKDGTSGGDPSASQGNAADLGDASESFGESLSELGAYDGYFEDDAVDVTVECVSGTQGCYTLDGNVLTFTAVGEDSVYSVSGRLKGSIVIDVGDDYGNTAQKRILKKVV